MGVVETKAKLYIQEVPIEKRQLELKKAQAQETKVKKERVRVEKTEIRQKKGKLVTEETSKSVDVQEVHAIEGTEEIPAKTAEEGVARPIIPIQQPLETEAVASCKKIDEQEETLEILEEKASKKLKPLQPLSISETVPEDLTEEMKDKFPDTEVATSSFRSEVKEQASVTEVKLEEIIERVEKLIVQEEIKMSKEISEVLDLIQAKEFGPGESPLRELAEIGYLVRNGISINEITVLYSENKFPSLKAPNAQSALVNVVERKGHSALITEVLTEETTSDEGKLAATVGFKAFMKMIELKHATVEEVITHFSPDDFIQRVWESKEISEVSSILLATLTQKLDTYRSNIQQTC